MSIIEKNDKWYYKLINDDTGETEAYLTASLPIKDDKILETLGLDGLGYRAESCTEEEYKQNADDEESDTE